MLTHFLLLTLAILVSIAYGGPGMTEDLNLPGDKKSGEASFYNEWASPMVSCNPDKCPEDGFCVALPMKYMGPKGPSKESCGKCIKIVYPNGKKAAIARVMDSCPGCDGEKVDLSDKLFEKLTGDKGLGRVKIEWAFVDCGSGSSSGSSGSSSGTPSGSQSGSGSTSAGSSVMSGSSNPSQKPQPTANVQTATALITASMGCGCYQPMCDGDSQNKNQAVAPTKATSSAPTSHTTSAVKTSSSTTLSSTSALTSTATTSTTSTPPIPLASTIHEFQTFTPIQPTGQLGLNGSKITINIFIHKDNKNKL